MFPTQDVGISCCTPESMAWQEGAATGPFRHFTSCIIVLIPVEYQLVKLLAAVLAETY